LLSMPLLSHLTDHADHDARAARLAALHDLTLDHMRVMMIVVDRELIVTQINAAARAHLSVAEHDALGHPLASILPPMRRALLVDAAARVRDTGLAEGIEFESNLFARRRLQARLAPFDGGVTLFFEDMSLADDLAAARASADALAVLCDASGRVATGRFSPRGLIENPPASLEAMVGVEADQLRGIRLTSIFDVADRPRVNAAIDSMFDQDRPAQLTARLLRHGADAVSVTLALARVDPHDPLGSARYLIVDRAAAVQVEPTA
jgi:hypothetical protein